MLKEALTILLTLVYAHQTVSIEIHDPAPNFYTDFTEDSGCSGTSLGCGGDWQITSGATVAPDWLYSTNCLGFYTAQSPIVKTYTMTASQSCGNPSTIKISTITMDYYCSC